VTQDSLPPQSHAADESAAHIARAILQSPQAGRAARGRAHFFPGVADALWNDWRWQFRNRVHALHRLAAMLPFPPQERAALLSLSRAQYLRPISAGPEVRERLNATLEARGKPRFQVHVRVTIASTRDFAIPAANSLVTDYRKGEP
jgi:hypothetical protein